MIRRLALCCLSSVVICGFLVLSAGCNTVKGAGKDIEKGGEAVQKAAD